MIHGLSCFAVSQVIFSTEMLLKLLISSFDLSFVAQHNDVNTDHAKHFKQSVSGINCAWSWFISHICCSELNDTRRNLVV